MKPLLIMILFVIGCGKAPATFSVKPQVIDPAFQAYVTQFESDAVAHGLNLKVATSIVFGDPLSVVDEANIVGACDYTTNTVVISPAYWNYTWEMVDPLTGLDLEKKNIIYHELGHCALNRHAHVNTTETWAFCWEMGGMALNQAQCPGPNWTTLQVPVSIMNQIVTVTNVDEVTASHEQQLVDELFSNAEVK